MKKQIYFTIIGIGALLAIIGFFPGGMSGIWGVLIAGITGVIYYFNKRNDEKVQERLGSGEESVTPDAGSLPEEPTAEPGDTAPSEEEPPKDDTDQ
jgi:hypothetical protein